MQINWFRKSLSLLICLTCDNPISKFIRSYSFQSGIFVLLLLFISWFVTNTLWIVFTIFKSRILTSWPLSDYHYYIIISMIGLVISLFLGFIHFVLTFLITYIMFRRVKKNLKNAFDLSLIQNIKPFKRTFLSEFDSLQRVVFEVLGKLRIYTSYIPQQELKKLEDEMPERLGAIKNSTNNEISYDQIKSFGNSARFSLSDSYSITVNLPGQVLKKSKNSKNLSPSKKNVNKRAKSPSGSKKSQKSSHFSPRNNLLDIGLYPIEATVMCIKLFNFASLFVEYDSFMKQFEMLSNTLDTLIKSSKSQIAYFDADKMIFFWDGSIVKNHEYRACEVALRILQTVTELNIMWGDDRRFKIGIGISCGETMIGNIGCEGDLKRFTIHSYSCDIANSLSDLCSIWHVDCLVDNQIYPKIRNHFLSRAIAYEVLVKSIHYETPNDTVSAFQLGKRMKLGEDEWLYSLQNQLDASLWDKFNQGMEYYRSGEGKYLHEALSCIQKHLQISPDDYVGKKWLRIIEKELRDVNDDTHSKDSYHSKLSYNSQIPSFHQVNYFGQSIASQSSIHKSVPSNSEAYIESHIPTLTPITPSSSRVFQEFHINGRRSSKADFSPTPENIQDMNEIEYVSQNCKVESDDESIVSEYPKIVYENQDINSMFTPESKKDPNLEIQTNSNQEFATKSLFNTNLENTEIDKDNDKIDSTDNYDFDNIINIDYDQEIKPKENDYTNKLSEELDSFHIDKIPSQIYITSIEEELKQEITPSRNILLEEETILEQDSPTNYLNSPLDENEDSIQNLLTSRSENLYTRSTDSPLKPSYSQSFNSPLSFVLQKVSSISTSLSNLDLNNKEEISHLRISPEVSGNEDYEIVSLSPSFKIEIPKKYNLEEEN